jgi:hypothetical protein
VGQKGEKKPSQPKNGIWAQNQYPPIENFTWRKKIYTFEGKKSENKPKEPKFRFWAL